MWSLFILRSCKPLTLWCYPVLIRVVTLQTTDVNNDICGIIRCKYLSQSWKVTWGREKPSQATRLPSEWRRSLGVSALLRSWSGFPSTSPPSIPAETQQLLIHTRFYLLSRWISSWVQWRTLTNLENNSWRLSASLFTVLKAFSCCSRSFSFTSPFRSRFTYSAVTSWCSWPISFCNQTNQPIRNVCQLGCQFLRFFYDCLWCFKDLNASSLTLRQCLNWWID